MDKIILFAILAIFPFGQLLGHWPIDIAAGIIFLHSLIFNRKRSVAFKVFGWFILSAVFSYVLSIAVFKSNELLVGGEYLLRVIIYWFFLDLCIGIVKKYAHFKELLFNSLIVISFSSAVFGWIQYLLYPDLTALKYLGWDDHLYRLVGTFLDPGFTSLIIVLGTILTIFAYLRSRKRALLLLIVFFLLSLAFTYSRAGYLALFVGLGAVAVLTKKVRFTLLLIISLVAAILILPKPAGEGVNLVRTYSISSRIQNYQETLLIFEKSPVVGVGFNNLCLSRKVYLGLDQSGSHSCSGSDSSLLLILATTGTTGLIMFISVIVALFKLIKRDFYTEVLIVSGMTLFIHSLFTNSLFYPWVMVYFALLLSLQKFKERSSVSEL
jgi:O-antigen ligase